MAAKPISINYEPREYFKSFHARNQRWAAVNVHRRAGKTYACLAELLTRALLTRKPAARFGYVAPFIKQAKAVAWRDLKRIGGDTIAKSNENELTVILVNGAEVRLFGADNPDSLRGLYFDGLVIDEVASMKESVWSEVLRPTLSDRKGWGVFISTPKGRNKFYRIVKHARKNPHTWFSLELKASQTNILSASELRDAREEMGEAKYAQEFECDFTAAVTGTYYGEQMRRVLNGGRVFEFDVDTELPVHVVADLGSSDALALWMFQVARDEVHLVDYFEAPQYDVKTTDTLLREKRYSYGTLYLPHDAEHKTFAADTVLKQFIQLGWKCKIVKRIRVHDGIQAVKKILAKSYFRKSTTERGVECLQLYHRQWNDSTQTFNENPAHDQYSHGADAFRYLAVALPTIRTDDTVDLPGDLTANQLDPRQTTDNTHGGARTGTVASVRVCDLNRFTKTATRAFARV